MNNDKKKSTNTAIGATQKSDQSNISNAVTKTKTNVNKEQIADSQKTKSSGEDRSVDMLNQVIQKRYKIEALVGHGGMCDVYRAKDLMLESAGDSQPYVAIKLLQKEFHDQPDAARILIREARKTQSLSHPNIIKVHSFGGFQNNFYLVMEWLDGQTLDEVIKSHRPNGLSYKKSMAVLTQILSALRYAHENGVVHADLKPGNIMLSRSGTVKIFDFGVSRALNINADKYSAEKLDDTSPISGYTPTYASPELLKGASPTMADDIFAFSCITYELLASKHPFQRKTALQAIKENLSPSKPQNISFIRWWTLRQGLLLESKKRIEDIPRLERGLTRPYGKMAASAGLLALVAVTIGYSFVQQNHQIQTLSEVQQTQEQSEALLTLPPAEFLPQLTSLTEELHMPAQVWLREQQLQAINYYENQIDDLLNRREHAYPDYNAIQAVLYEANALYPDSYRLAITTEEINQGWNSTIKALSERLDTHLEQGNYQRSDDGEDIYTIYRDLQQVRKDYQFVPNSKAEKIFASRFDQAAQKLDTVALNAAIDAGETFFSHSEQQQPRIVMARALKGAVQTMAAYQTRLSEDGEASFPYAAAEHFYQAHFESITEQVTSSTQVTTLNGLESEVAALAKKLPYDFPYLVEAREAMANRYLYFSGILLNKHKTQAANTVMKKAQDLLTLVQQARATTRG
jgi:serine/threonine protein kinase